MNPFNQLESTEYTLYDNNMYWAVLCVMYSAKFNLDHLI